MKAFQFLSAARRPLTVIEMTGVFGGAWAGDVTRAHRPLPAAVKLPAGEGLSTPAQPLRSRRLIGTRRYVLGAVQAGNRMRSGGWRGCRCAKSLDPTPRSKTGISRESGRPHVAGSKLNEPASCKSKRQPNKLSRSAGGAPHHRPRVNRQRPERSNERRVESNVAGRSPRLGCGAVGKVDGIQGCLRPPAAFLDITCWPD